jgi:hypothetical protein
MPVLRANVTPVQDVDVNCNAASGSAPAALDSVIRVDTSAGVDYGAYVDVSRYLVSATEPF